MPAPATAPEILDVNRRYHDVAADEYDAKWGISFTEVGRKQVVGKLSKLLGARPGPFGRSLEIGAGTGYFSLNMLRAGVVREAVCTDISPGMLRTLEANAAKLGLAVETVASDAASLPFEDESFDLVFGHAVLHHLPDLDRAFAEFHRVLKPGGTLFFAGEPSRQGDRIAAVPKRVAWRLSPLWRRARARAGRRRTSTDTRRRPATTTTSSRRSTSTRSSRPISRARRAAAGFERRARARRGAAGQLVRLVQPHAGGERRPAAHPDAVDPLRPQGLPRCCSRSTAALLEGRLPPQLFYNLMLAASKPQS